VADLIFCYGLTSSPLPIS